MTCYLLYVLNIHFRWRNLSNYW